MEQQNTRLRNAGFATFFFSGICAISAGVVVSLLQERYGFAYGMTGTLLSLMSVGNLLAGLLMGMLPSALGMKRSVLLLTIGYAVGYAVMGLTGAVVLLAAAFFVVGIAKGSVINTCTILVSDHSADRTRGMNLMHSCYACGALLCPFLIAAAARVSTELAVFLLAAVGLVLWLVYVFTPLRGGKGKSNAEKEAIDWSFLRSARFWLLTGLLFFQNAAEQSVNGWMVTYFKGSGIIAGTLAAYTVTVMWGATLVGRLLIAFVFPLKNPRKAMVGMSVLCTVFYVLLYYVWRKRYQIEGQKNVTVAVYALSAVRVVLCMMPQNRWLTNHTPLTWGILRNVPFALLGLLIIVLFYRSAKQNNDKAFRWMWLTIVLSFGFYIPVVLWADVNPLIGMLMIPKTCAYVWTVLIGYNAMKAETGKQS